MIQRSITPSVNTKCMPTDAVGSPCTSRNNRAYAQYEEVTRNEFGTCAVDRLCNRNAADQDRRAGPGTATATSPIRRRCYNGDDLDSTTVRLVDPFRLASQANSSSKGATAASRAAANSTAAALPRCARSIPASAGPALRIE